MIIRNLLIFLLSFICLCACSKKQDSQTESESSSPIMAIVNESPAPDASTSVADLRDPLQNIVVNTDSGINNAAPQNQNLAADIPPSYTPVQADAAQEEALQNNMQKPFNTAEDSIAGIERDRNVTVTRTASGYTATAVLVPPTLKQAEETGIKVTAGSVRPQDKR